MAYKLAVDDKVCVSVKGKLPTANKGSPLRFDFTLTMRRINQDEINELMKSGEAPKDVVAQRIEGWDGQRLVLEEDGTTPAPCNPEAVDALLRIPGMAVWVLQSYIRDLGVQEKN